MPQQHNAFPDERIERIRTLLHEHADPQHALFHREYHKSQLMFHGLRAPVLKQLYRSVFPSRSRLDEDGLSGIVNQLWHSGCWEETMLAIMLLERHQRQLPLDYIASILTMTRECEGWAQLDGLACGVLSQMALRFDAAEELRRQFYGDVAAWAEDSCMWTRRASILVHIHPARQARLAEDYCWDTWASRLHEKEFFIRKAIGWVLREASKQYPQQVHDFLLRVGDRASGLTRREGARNLPSQLRIGILGK
ncbi:MAG: DNA alkylation repair protein [Planctomycetales bacterium]|nr:DNA alkylation repair protein [bacterium]UNM08256.1 MAG: DNA alkylation repair protein [Planctomycetales bacterium]